MKTEIYTNRRFCYSAERDGHTEEKPNLLQLAFTLGSNANELQQYVEFLETATSDVKGFLQTVIDGHNK